MENIAIYGAGGFGREVACLLKSINHEKPTWNLIGFWDDGKEKGYKTEYGDVLGGLDDLNKYSTPFALVVAIGNPKIVSQIISSVNNPLISFPNIIAPDVVFLDIDNVSLGIGNIICNHCWISCNVNIGDFNILNVGVTVGHDSTLGNFNSLMPVTKISGEICIGNRNFFGVASVVLQQISIGNDTVIGANSLVIRKTKDGETYVGSPAIKVKY